MKLNELDRTSLKNLAFLYHYGSKANSEGSLAKAAADEIQRRIAAGTWR